jgi:hypothetical protein
MKHHIFLLFFIVLGSCTITKRVHNPGWHVEWKSSASAGQEQTNPELSKDERSRMEVTQETVTTTQTEEENSSAMLNSSESNPREEHVFMTDSPTTKTTDAARAETSSHFERVSAIKQSRHNPEVGVDNRKLHPYLFVSFGFFMGSLLSLILTVSGIFAAIQEMLLLMLFLVALFGLLSFIFASIANRAIKKSPELWKGESGGTLLFIFGIILTVTAILVAVVLVLFALSFLALFL